jgi:hypothetical protein
MTTTDSVAASAFSLNLNTGELTLLTALSYALSQHLYTFNLTVAEKYSGFTTSVPVSTVTGLMAACQRVIYDIY